MLHDVSATGVVLSIKSFPTLPVGLMVTDFAADTDPIDFDEKTVAETTVNINGLMITSSAPTSNTMKLSVIPGGITDRTLAVLLKANTASFGRIRARDNVTAVVLYPNGTKTTLTDGVIIAGPAAQSISSGGQIKTATYTFTFQDVT